MKAIKIFLVLVLMAAGLLLLFAECDNILLLMSSKVVGVALCGLCFRAWRALDFRL